MWYEKDMQPISVEAMLESAQKCVDGYERYTADKKLPKEMRKRARMLLPKAVAWRDYLCGVMAGKDDRTSA